MQTIINIAKDFSKYPGPRYERLGKFSGEKFRDDILMSALGVGEVVVQLDGTVGYGSSFLHEAFGGAARKTRVGKDNLRLESDDEYLVRKYGNTLMMRKKQSAQSHRPNGAAQHSIGRLRRPMSASSINPAL